MEEDWRAKMERERSEAEARSEAYHKRREAFRERLFDSPDALVWQAPPPVDDFDALLAEHAAQIRNAVRQTMGIVLNDGNKPQSITQAAAALTRLIQANIAIAKVLGAKDTRETPKTVRGVAKPKGAQD